MELMSNYNFYLNSDKSVQGIVSDSGKIILTSNHKNLRNVSCLISNLQRILTAEQKGQNLIVKLKDIPFIEINKKTNEVKNLNELTSFETRIFSRSVDPELLPFLRSNKKPKQLETDLHTHFAAALSPEQLVECGIGQGVKYPEWLTKKLKIDTRFIQKEADGTYLLENLISSKQNYDTIVSSMKIDTSEQETFNKMEEIYVARGPFSKNPNMFVPMLKQIALDAKNNGVNYLELSLSSIISNMSQLALVEQNLPQIESETGVKLRFLGAMSRHSDKEWNEDEVERLKIASKSPYIVGCDFMGHETNPTSDFYPQIKELAKYAILNDPSFVIRVHAGENVLFKNNVRQVLLAVEDAHRELSQQMGREMPYPQVRIGHGIYGFDEAPSWDESDETKTISTLELCNKIKPIIEFNMSSNLSLNNINFLSEIPIKKYIDSGVQVVLGTDGRGIYSTSISQEMLLAKQAGLTLEDFKKISNTEEHIKNLENKRFLSLQGKAEGQSFYIGSKQKGLKYHYTPEVEVFYKNEEIKRQERLQEEIARCGAETRAEKIKEALKFKKPILITGSSHKHFPKILEHPDQLSRIQIVLDVLVHAVDPQKAYFITGGTNHGVEKELHKIANEFNKNGANLVVLGTLTEEAVKDSNSPDERVRNSNKIEKNTITHAIVPIQNGKAAKRWFDLPDTVLSIVQSSQGKMIAIGGGAIVGDMILRGHNMGLDMEIMSEVEGASGDKAKALKGNSYEFFDAKELLNKLLKDNRELLRDDLSNEKINQLITEAEQRQNLRNQEEKLKFQSQNSVEIKNKKGEKSMKQKVVLHSVNPKEYGDREIEVEVVDLATQLDEITSPEVFKAVKVAKVQARPAKAGELVDTNPRVIYDGKVYTFSELKKQVTQQMQDAGAMVIINPDGEEYLNKTREQFNGKYDKVEGGYVPKEGAKTFRKVTKDCAIELWGSLQVVSKGSVILIEDGKGQYSITNAAFDATYSTAPEKIAEREEKIRLAQQIQPGNE